jgi:hypothetical protein
VAALRCGELAFFVPALALGIELVGVSRRHRRAEGLFGEIAFVVMAFAGDVGCTWNS